NEKSVGSSHEYFYGRHFHQSHHQRKARLRRPRRRRECNGRQAPTPCIFETKDGSYLLLLGRISETRYRVGDPLTRIAREEAAEVIQELWSGTLVLITRRFMGAGQDPSTSGLRWFKPSLWRYRKPLAYVLVASVCVQIFALVTPLLFQVVIDKVLVHKGISTLIAIVVGLAGISFFEVVLQFLRTYVLTHTTNRIDVELGSRLFDHLLKLPLAYFETRPTGQTVARIRELETVRGFLTGPSLTAIIDLAFTIIFFAVLWLYSPILTFIVACSIPFYIVIAAVLRPILRDSINDRFNTGALSQQFLVESIFGIQTLKSAAVEPILRNEWEGRLASYVRSSFHAGIIASFGQNAVQYISKITTALVLFFGAKAVIDNELTVGALIAFNMIMGQVTAPVLRLSQLWQDFQQVQISLQRLGDILSAPPESRSSSSVPMQGALGEVVFKEVSFRYRPDQPAVLDAINLRVPAGGVIGIVGSSGSGKSTLAKLIQGLYRPDRGQILLDGVDISQVDTAWLRRQIGVVLQENTLFNRSVHDNIALGVPAMTRAQVIQVARLAGAHEFISQMPLGYDTLIDERGVNLSGGQRQRIAIARALATRPRILIFDEATSALDYESERIIRDNMKQIVHGRTVFIIAHRLAAVRNCDRIIAVQSGKIVEEGTHAQLLQKPDGAYAKLWRIQMSEIGD
ncbi:MAG: type I secretion system permease/ATPase, partial [Hyphomicrobiales bacterium]